MARYIDADEFEKLCDVMADKCDGLGKIIWQEIKNVVCCQPTADVHEVRNGKWQIKPLFHSNLEESETAVYVRCSSCGMKLIAQKCGPFPNYCANCGAKMEAKP